MAMTPCGCPETPPSPTCLPGVMHRPDCSTRTLATWKAGRFHVNAGGGFIIHIGDKAFSLGELVSRIEALEAEVKALKEKG